MMQAHKELRHDCAARRFVRDFMVPPVPSNRHLRRIGSRVIYDVSWAAQVLLMKWTMKR